MEDEDRRDEDRGPGCVEQRQQHRRGPEAGDGVEVLLRRQRGGVLWCHSQAAEGCRQHPPVQPILQPRTDPRHDPAPCMVQNPHHQEQESHQQRQREKRLFRARDEHPVIDLQHVERRGQHQQVDQRREEEGERQRPARGGARGGNLGQAGRDFGGLLRGRCHRSFLGVFLPCAAHLPRLPVVLGKSGFYALPTPAQDCRWRRGGRTVGTWV